MHDSHELAALIRDVLKDRRENGTQAHLAFEVASLRAFMFSTLNSIDHIIKHVENDEIRDKRMMIDTLTHLTKRIEDSMANLEDVRLELRRTAPHNDSEH